MKIIIRPPAIGILINEYELAARVIDEARRMGFEVYWEVMPDRFPLRVRYVISDRKEVGREIIDRRVIYVDDYSSIRCTLLRIIIAELPKTTGKLVEISIDPGKVIGAAFAVDSVVIGVGTYNSLNTLIEEITNLLTCLNTDREVKIYIGESGGDEVHEILNELKNKISEAEFTIIPEDGTDTLKLTGQFTRDEKSALLIYHRARSQLKWA